MTSWPCTRVNYGHYNDISVRQQISVDRYFLILPFGGSQAGDGRVTFAASHTLILGAQSQCQALGTCMDQGASTTRDPRFSP